MADSTHQVTDNVVESRTPLVGFAQTRAITLFSLLTYAWSWALWLAIATLIPDNQADTFGVPLFLTGAFGPMVAALMTRWLTDRDLKICPVWTGWSSLGRGRAFGLGAFFRRASGAVGSDCKGARFCAALAVAFALEHVHV